MTTSKGPWSYDAESGYVTTKDTTGMWGNYSWSNSNRGPAIVCSVESLDGISNGDLLAAAPDMRDALKDAYPYIRDDALRARIGALIAKVEGV